MYDMQTDGMGALEEKKSHLPFGDSRRRKIMKEKIHYLSRDPFARLTGYKRSVRKGECSWCGQNKQLWAFGWELASLSTTERSYDP